jgi:hypothetical protein
MHVRLSKLASPLKPEAIGTFTDGVLDVAHIDCPSARRQLPRPMMSATCLMVNYPVVLGWENADVVPVLRLSTIGSGLPPCSVRAHHGRIRTKSRDRLYGSSVGMAAERAAAARKEADKLACDAWNKRMLAFKGPAQPSPTLGDALNAGYGYLEVRCLGCDPPLIDPPAPETKEPSMPKSEA